MPYNEPMRKTFDDMMDAIPLGYRSRIQNVEYLRGLLDSGYGQLWRKYHNYNHICDMLQKITPLIVGASQQYSLFAAWEYIVAIIFHDVVYELGAPFGENEENSLDIATIYGPRCIQVDWKIVKVLIRATTHDGKLDHPALRLMADLDLSTFSSTTEFPIANAMVQAEYETRFTPEQVRYGRLEFLKSFLQRPQIFYLDDFFNNEIAFKNIAQAIKELE